MTSELIVVSIIILVLIALASFFGWRQLQTFARLRQQTQLPRDDRSYYRNQAWRRLVGCFLMVVLAGLLSGSYLLGFDRQAQELARQVKENGPETTLSAEQQRFINFYGTYWALTLLVLFVMLMLALVDLWSIRTYGLRHFRKILDDRRAMLERQTAMMRSDRNGQGG